MQTAKLNLESITEYELLEAALIGLEIQRGDVILKMTQLRQQLNGADGSVEGFTVAEPERQVHANKGRHRSAAVRRKMSLAQKRSWARRRRAAA